MKSFAAAAALAALLIGAVPGTGSAQNPSPCPDIDAAAEEYRIRDVYREWNEAIVARDVERIVGIYAPDGRFLIPSAPAAEGRDAIRAAWEETLRLPDLTLSFEPDVVQVARCGDMAFDVGRYAMAFAGPEGRVQDQGNYVVVWEKKNGRWLAAADIFNSTAPAR